MKHWPTSHCSQWPTINWKLSTGIAGNGASGTLWAIVYSSFRKLCKSDWRVFLAIQNIYSKMQELSLHHSLALIVQFDIFAKTNKLASQNLKIWWFRSVRRNRGDSFYLVPTFLLFGWRHRPRPISNTQGLLFVHVQSTAHRQRHITYLREIT